MLCNPLSTLGGMYRRLICSKIGHDPSWTLGAMYGLRPVRKRCDAELSKTQLEALDARA